jgi:predicted ester cyclase
MKNPIFVLSLVLLLCFAFGCQNKAEKVELEKFRTQAKVEEQNKEIVKRFFEEFPNKGNIEIFNELCAPDYSYYFPSNNPKPMSREEQIEEEKMALRAIPNLNLRIEKLFAVGDTVIIWGIVTGNHQGEYQGIPPTGNKIEISNIIIMRFKDGEVLEVREEANILGMMQQLGMELKPKEVKK